MPGEAQCRILVRLQVSILGAARTTADLFRCNPRAVVMLRDAWYARRSDASGVEAGSARHDRVGLAYQNGVGTKASSNLARHCMPSDTPWVAVRMRDMHERRRDSRSPGGQRVREVHRR